MALSLRTQTAGGASGWHLGETRAIASKDETIDLGDGAQAICRDIARTIPASSYNHALMLIFFMALKYFFHQALYIRLRTNIEYLNFKTM